MAVLPEQSGGQNSAYRSGCHKFLVFKFPFLPPGNDAVYPLAASVCIARNSPPLAEINRCKSIKRTELFPISSVQSNSRNCGDTMKTKMSKTLFTAILTGAMALGTGTSLGAQDQSMEKPSAGVNAQVDQAPPPEQ